MARPKITVPGTAATIRAQREKQRAYDRDPELYERKQRQRKERRERKRRKERLLHRQEWEEQRPIPEEDENVQDEWDEDLPF